MYKNILIPLVFDSETDHSKVIALAKSLAAPEANITLLHVIELAPSYVISYVPEEASRQIRAEVSADMDAMTQKIPGAQSLIETGHAGRSIVDIAKNRDMDLIIVQSHRPGFEDYFLGSTAAYIVRRAQCSVHVVR